MAHDLTYPLKRTGRACPALCPGHVLLKRIPLDQPPSLRGLRRPSSDIVRPLPRYYGAVRPSYARSSLDCVLRLPNAALVPL